MTSPTPNDPADVLTPERLKKIGLFGGMETATLDRLCRSLPVQRAEPGDCIVEEGAVSQSMYVVVHGELEVVKRGTAGGDVRVALLGDGDWFGEMSLLDVQPRSASVHCVSPAILVAISHQDVDALLYRVDPKAYTLLIMNIARELSRRLRVADGILAHVAVTMATDYSRGSGAR